MANNYLELHLLADDYLQGKLSERQTAEFEERLVWDQEAMDEVELAETLRNALRAGNTQSLTTAEPTLREKIAAVLLSPNYAIAASVLLVASLAFNAVTMQAGNPNSPVSQPFNAAATPQIVAPLGVRSADAQTVVLDPERWVVLLVDIVDAYSVYRVSIASTRDAESPFWQQSGLQATYPEALAVGMPASALAPNLYTLRLEGLTDDTGEGTAGYQLVTEIPFRTVSSSDE